jgi:hypothetical protein
VAVYLFAKNMKKLIIFSILFIVAFASDAFAQWKDSGKFNVWSSSTISRRYDHEADTYLKEVKVGKNKGFDRVVFEFTGNLPNYLIEYTKQPIMNTAEKRITLGGKFFIYINLQLLPYPEDEKLANIIIPKGKLNFPAVSEVKEIEWFEGVRDFAVGLNAKKLYRVQQLKNPTRLVIDFKQ